MEISRPWAGTTVGDAGPYTAPHWWDVWQSMGGGSGALTGAGNRGVLGEVPGKLGVSYVAPNTLHVAAGAALIDGLFYCNDSIFSATVTSASAGQVRDDRLVVRKYFSGLIQTARITLLPGAEAATPGPGTPPALIQDTTRQTYWDLPLARISITELGVITVTDERMYASPAGRSTLVNVVYGYDNTHAFVLPVLASVQIPNDAQSHITAAIVVIPQGAGKAWISPIIGNAGAGGNVYVQYGSTAGRPGADPPVGLTTTTGYRALAAAGGGVFTKLPALDLMAGGFAAGDVLFITFDRDATNLADTVEGSIMMYGWELELQ